MQRDAGPLGRKQRRWAWVVFFALATYAPVVAYALRVPLVDYTLPPDTWMLSVTVASLVATVLIIDDVTRRARANQDVADDVADDEVGT